MAVTEVQIAPSQTLRLRLTEVQQGPFPVALCIAGDGHVQYARLDRILLGGLTKKR